MENELERNLGEQPIAKIMQEQELSAKDLVKASTEQLTHKKIANAIKGRRLTVNVKVKIRNALNTINENDYSLEDLFNY